MKKLLPVIPLLFCLVSRGQSLGNQYLDSFTLNGYKYKYLYYLPDDYNSTSNNYPLIVFFYGLGHDPDKPNSVLLNQGPAEQIADGWNAQATNPITGTVGKFIVMSLQTPTYNGQTDGWHYTDPVKTDNVLKYLIPRFRVNTDNIYLEGISAGGNAVFAYISQIGFTPAYTPAAVTPMSAASVDTNSIDVTKITNRNIRVWAYGSDTNVGNSDIHGYMTHLIVNKINRAVPQYAKFTNYKGGHCCWSQFFEPTYKKAYQDNNYNLDPISNYQFYLLYSHDTSHVVITNVIPDSTICVSDSVGANISVIFNSSGTYNSGNIYKAQLSTATGSFSGLTLIGSDTTTAHSGTIQCYIPPGMPTGTGYRVRVNATDPHVIGLKSPTKITINLASNSIAPTADQNITVNTNGTPLTVTEQSTPLSRKWKYGTTLGNYNHTIAGATGTTYTPNFANANTFYVVCKSFFTCDSINSNPVKVIVSSAFAGSSHNINSSALSVQANKNYISCNYMLSQNGKVTLSMYDAFGHSYGSFSETNIKGPHSHTFNALLRSGVYFVTLSLNNTTIATRQLMISQ